MTYSVAYGSRFDFKGHNNNHTSAILYGCALKLVYVVLHICKNAEEFIQFSPFRLSNVFK